MMWGGGGGGGTLSTRVTTFFPTAIAGRAALDQKAR